MLDKYSYVFIIGAGGSFPYGFPLGIDLYDNICGHFPYYVQNYLEENQGTVRGINTHLMNIAHEFSKQLRSTNNVSIDKYLNINTSFYDEGILAIISEIFNCEKQSLLPPNVDNKYKKNDWYSYLYQKMIQGLNTIDDILSINKNKISFITFNYDRSLEHYLFNTLYGLVKNAGVQKKQFAEIFCKIPFIHVFGNIGNLPWQKGEYSNNLYYSKEWVEYGSEIKDVDPISVAQHIKDKIQIMYEKRQDNLEINNAKELILNADRILFLGFGYDEQNLEILDLPELLKNKQVFGTAFNATDNEIVHIRNLLNLKMSSPKSKIYSFDSLMLLREHLI